MTDYGSFDDGRIKHLEMIQAVIGRLGNDGFLIKGWAVTVTGAFLGFAVSRDRWQLALVSIAPTLLFWILDASFLRNERLFRDLFERVRKGEGDVDPFFMGATGDSYLNLVRADRSRADLVSRWLTFWRPVLVVFYGAVLTAAVVVSVVICCT